MLESMEMSCPCKQRCKDRKDSRPGIPLTVVVRPIDLIPLGQMEPVGDHLQP
jgi:hypothetical protein